MVRVEFRVQGAKRLTAINKNISVTLNKGFNTETIDKGYDFARNIVPQKTGATLRAIQKITSKKSGRIRLIQPNNRDGRNRPYHMWFHGIKAPSPTGKNGAGRGYDLRNNRYSPKSGVPDFMDKTFIYMQKESKKSIEEQLKQMFK